MKRVKSGIEGHKLIPIKSLLSASEAEEYYTELKEAQEQVDLALKPSEKALDALKLIEKKLKESKTRP